MKKTKNKLASRFRNINMLFVVNILIAIIAVSAVMILNLTDSAAKSSVHSYTMETAHILASYLNREIMLVRHAAGTKEIIEWFIDEKNPEKRFAAYQRMMHYADMLQIGSVYFVISSSLDEYSIDSGMPYSAFAPFDSIDPDNLYDQWFFEALNSDFDFTLNLDVDKVTDTRRIWINYKIMDNGKPIGIFCSALQFDDVFTELFSLYDHESVIGYIIDENGIIQISSYMPEPDLIQADYTVYDFDEERHIFDINSEPSFTAIINSRLKNPVIHNSLRIETDAAKLTSGNFQYMSIAPIPNTNWFTVTFFSSSALFDISNALIPIIIVVLAFIVFVTASSVLIQKIVFKPLHLFTQSVSKAINGNLDIYGIERDDEFGELSRAAKETLENLRDTAAKLETARNEAETASRSKSIFLANMSHEIRTPMNAILGVTEILIENETLPAEIEEGLDKIYSSCDMLLGIINDILDFSKIEAGKLDIIPAKYKIASLLNDSAQLNMMRMNGKPIEFELHACENIPSKLIGDEIRIKQILNNLLSNAFKYTDSGKVTLTASCETATEADKTILVLSVRDTGHGMTEDQLKKLFDEYSRFTEEKFRAVEGTGLGLAITHRLINLMNGVIMVESKPGAGSLFTVKLPQNITDSELLGKDVSDNLRQFRMNYITQRKRNQVLRDPMPYGSVLIVDDVETNLYVAAGLMKLYRLQIDTVMSGAEAIERIKSGKVYDVVFMDHMMPEMDGIEATQKIREWESEANCNNRSSHKRTPIVALTANAVFGQSDIFLQNGFDNFISKPIDIRQLNAVLNKYVRDKHPPEVIEAARKQKYSNGGSGKKKQNEPMLLESFIRDARKALNVLGELANNAKLDTETDLHKFTVTVHGIKSSLWNIGETMLSELAQKLEEAARNKNTGFIKSSMQEFSARLEGLLLKQEEKYNADRKTACNDDEDTGELLNNLQNIIRMCDDYDRKGILDFIAGLNNCSKKTMSVLDTVKELVLHSEFEKAKTSASEYADEFSKNL
ncbi:MAG: ATP-binding protein [Treponema sp.]|nr:ATP-binding protein [Treponema sp.]